MKLTEQELINELRAMRPLPEPAFAAELDRRAADGFARERRLPQLRMRRLIPVAAAAATFIVVGGVAITQLQEDIGDEKAASGGAALESTKGIEPVGGASPQSGAAGADSAIAPAEPTTATPLPPPSGDLAPGAAKREVERTASLALTTDPGGVAEVADGVVEVTDRYKGFVVSSSVRTTDDETSRASFDLRVPTARLQDALADLSGLAHVKSRNEGSLDITAPVVSARERIADSRAELEGLLGQLAAAGSPEESDAIRAQVRIVRDELAAARAELDSLSQRADLTAINVEVTGTEDGGDGWTLGDAADDAVSVLRTTAGIALVSLAILTPLALLAALLWLGGRKALRRSRERALDS